MPVGFERPPQRVSSASLRARLAKPSVTQARGDTVTSVTEDGRGPGWVRAAASERTSSPTFPVHPLADVFPLMAGPALAALTADLAINGLLQPITLLDDAVLDGRSRLAGCMAAKVKPRFVHFTGMDPVPFAVAVHVSQRNLDVSQRAMVAAKLSRLAQDSIRRPNQAADGQGEQTVPPAMTISRAASLLNVSLSTAQAARSVSMCGVRELAAEVEAGVISVTAAADLSRLPADVQRIVAENPASSSIVAKAIRTQDPAALAMLPDVVCPDALKAVTKLLDTNIAQRKTGARTPAPSVAQSVERAPRIDSCPISCGRRWPRFRPRADGKPLEGGRVWALPDRSEIRRIYAWSASCAGSSAADRSRSPLPRCTAISASNALIQSCHIILSIELA